MTKPQGLHRLLPYNFNMIGYFAGATIYLANTLFGYRNVQAERVCSVWPVMEEMTKFISAIQPLAIYKL